ncbi:MAG: DNA polymerase III subunit delta' [Planctomycetes bacterium]|nr:DNA polymerase III subunit delta' [Planctomycetota bacterium]
MSFSTILGHQPRIDAFRQIVANQRLAHAYLFVGPPGVGKRLVALELAKAILCEAPGPSPAVLDACDSCAACLLVQAGTHPDLFQVARPEDKNEFPIAVMQELCRNFSFKAARGHGKIAIIDDADDFNDESANCFLKTLEEPPPGSLLILLGTSLDRQLSTIKSRCQMVRFAPLSDEHVRKLLTKQGIDNPSLIERLVRLAAGSPGQALALADETLWQFRRALLQGLTQPRIDSVALSRQFVEFAEQAGKDAPAQRRRVNQMLRLLIEAFTDVLRIQAGASARSAEPAELPLLASLAQRAGPDKIQAVLERCLETETQVGRYVQLSLVVEGLVDALGQILDHAGSLPARHLGFAN